jgi:hypothetical protein
VAATRFGRAARWVGTSAPGRFTGWVFGLGGRSWRWLAGGGALAGAVGGGGYAALKREWGSIFKSAAVGSVLGTLAGALLAFVLTPWGLLATGSAANYLLDESEAPPPAVAPEETGVEQEPLGDYPEEPAPADSFRLESQAPEAEPGPTSARDLRKDPDAREVAVDRAVARGNGVDYRAAPPKIGVDRVVSAASTPPPRTPGLIGGLASAQH